MFLFYQQINPQVSVLTQLYIYIYIYIYIFLFWFLATYFGPHKDINKHFCINTLK